jgi:MFS family permease
MANFKRFVGAFVIFGAAYFLSSLLRGVTAALASVFVLDFQLKPAELGLLGGSYFLGFAVMQLPSGAWLDRYGAKRVLITSLIVAAIGSYMFSVAQSLSELVIARFACGVGVSACLIAPLTAARFWLAPAKQQQVNLWMLMVGAFGLLVATLPSQTIANLFGWRIIFSITAMLFIVIVMTILFLVPNTKPNLNTYLHRPWFFSYGDIFKNRYTWKIAPLGFFNYAILVAVQTLWAGPWLTQVVGCNPDAAAGGLFGINLIMLVVFLGLGFVTPRLVKSASGAEGALRRILPFSVGALFLIPIFGVYANWGLFSLYCVGSAVLALTHPAVGQNFPIDQAGRAIAFFNLLLFLGVFFTQWGFGKIVAVINEGGHHLVLAYQVAFFVLALLSLLSYLWFVFFDKIFIKTQERMG